MPTRRPVDSLGAHQPSSRLTLQRAFFAEMSDKQPLKCLFDYLDDTYFFIKDRVGRLIAVNRPLFVRFGHSNEYEMIGTTDADRYPPVIAARYRADDELVLSNKPLIGRVEMLYNDHGLLDWFVTTKLPLLNRRDQVIGLMGIVRRWHGERDLELPSSRMASVLQRLRSDTTHQLTVGDLAADNHISPRHLQRECRSLFGIGIKELLLRTRLQAATQALRTTATPIAHIAITFGFCDQSAFTKRFQQHTGLTPARYRKVYKK
jgi:AraC-like DNA-binding protein